MRIVRMLGCLPLAATLGGCWTGIYENPFAQYVNRSDTVTLSAGDAKNVNAATHVVDPWPRYVGNRRIPGDGDRLATAVTRYHRPPQRGGGGQGPAQGGLTPVGEVGAAGAGAGASAGAAGASTGTPRGE